MPTIVFQRSTPHRLFEKGTGKLIETKTVDEIEYDDGTLTVLEKNVKKFIKIF